jgi:hypothetical protein
MIIMEKYMTSAATITPDNTGNIILEFLCSAYLLKNFKLSNPPTTAAPTTPIIRIEYVL